MERLRSSVPRKLGAFLALGSVVASCAAPETSLDSPVDSGPRLQVLTDAVVGDGWPVEHTSVPSNNRLDFELGKCALHFKVRRTTNETGVVEQAYSIHFDDPADKDSRTVVVPDFASLKEMFGDNPCVGMAAQGLNQIP